MEEMPLIRVIVPVASREVSLLAPDPAWMQARFQREQDAGLSPEAPYWSRIWPSARALASWLLNRTAMVAGKDVLELAAGLGLPSFVVAPHAKKVLGSDYLPDAVMLLERNAAQLGLKNYEARLLNWNNLPPDLSADILLLSDVNYAPGDFTDLLTLIERFLGQNTMVILATPQRIMGAAFIAALDPWIVEADSDIADGVPINIYRLENVR
ncbi:MAG: methyltransferase domain-containing protein [Chitinophagaceae bacterium]|nr:MAG: methyltransferase domain-containing protein [Chitinophagaceae bacterium]